MIGSTLIIGLGGPRGDAQAAWRLADAVGWQLAALNELRDEQVLLSQNPAEMLPWLHGVVRLVIFDSCAPGEAPIAGGKPLEVGQAARFLWPVSGLHSRHNCGDGDGTITKVLANAEQLNRLPAHVWIWTIATEEAAESDSLSLSLSPTIEAALPDVVRRVSRELTALIACAEEALPGAEECRPSAVP